MRWQRYVSLPLLLWCTACALFAPKEDHFSAKPITYASLSGWAYDNHAQALSSFMATCPLLADKPRDFSSGSNLRVPAEVWRSLCEDARSVPVDNQAQAQSFFERRFIPYRVMNNNQEQGLFTGYYEPLLYGSHRMHGDFIYPLYMPPPELASHSPYYTHAEINRGALRARKLELVWVDDPVMLFFLQIQGSGRVRMSDGSEMLVGYAGKNGQPYKSLGKIMGDEGVLAKDQINFFTLRSWLYQHSDKAIAMMERNPSYVFFKKLDQSGPVGAAGAVLMPKRSLAVDNKYIPYGLPLFMETELPAMPQAKSVKFQRLMMAQDTGGAIRGPVRGDIFFGGGDEAEYLAGYMKGRGIYSLLVPREIAYQLP